MNLRLLNVGIKFLKINLNKHQFPMAQGIYVSHYHTLGSDTCNSPIKKKREGIKSNAFDIPVGLSTSTLAC